MKDEETTTISRLALFSTFYTHLRKDEVIVTSNFKDKGVMEGKGWKTPPPPSPSATTRQKSPVLIGLSMT